MRIVLDLQGAQTEGSRFRGIGRYTLALAQAMGREARGHELWLALNGRFTETIEPIRLAFDGLVPPEHIAVFDVPRPGAELNPANGWRARAAELIREQSLAQLQPDWVHVSSLFEGLGDDAATSIGDFDAAIPTAVTLYDLTPYLRPDQYLANPRIRDWYLRKAQALKRAHVLLAISESSRQEAIEALGIPEQRVANISAGVDARFRPITLPSGEKQILLRRYGLHRPFVMYTGGVDARKNIEGLINAYALLPRKTRASCQLAIACKIQDRDRERLAHLAESSGLGRDEVIFTGYVPDDDLVGLYNTAKLFVFPSLHEGFGLPALEAMACGAPTIGSNCSCIPEVIARNDALFDPNRPAAIAEKIMQTLSDDAFRQELASYGLKQAQEFTWEMSAQRAWDALEEVQERRRYAPKAILAVSCDRPRLAYVSPLPPERSGIADYSAELLPELSRFFDIEVIVHQTEVSDPWISANFPVRDATRFEAHANRYDRILYHFGNSSFHAHMFDLLERYPGVVVLHDFYLGGIQQWREATGCAPHAFRKALYRSHAYPAIEHLSREGLEAAIWTYPCNRDVVDHATGVIVHSQHCIGLADQWYGEGFARDWHQIPQLRIAAPFLDRRAARERLGLPPEDFLVCSFGLLGPIKLSDRLLAAWLMSRLAQDPCCRLVFVGENHGGDYGQHLLARIGASGVAQRIHITGFAEAQTFKDYLAAADVAVQLRTRSRGETSRAVLDCLAHGLPVIVNAHGANAEYPPDVLMRLDDAFTDEALAHALEQLYRDPARRMALGCRAASYIREHHHPARIAATYRDALEQFAASSPNQREQRLLHALGAIACPVPLGEADLLAVSQAIATNRPAVGPRQWLVDLSELVRCDAKSGIQRVARSLLFELLRNPPQGFRLEPVYAEVGQYRYARRFMLRLLGSADDGFEDTPIEVRPGDVFFGLDLAPSLVPGLEACFANMHARRVSVFFVVYDLLPVLRPDVFDDAVDRTFSNWLGTVARVSDGLICISRAVAGELKDWLDANQPPRQTPLRLGYFHLGADIESSAPTSGMAPDADATLTALCARPTLLMVGTVEPRKGHAQALAAFETLWHAGVEVNLAIVGKQGWSVDLFIERLRSHPQLGCRLFWLEGISDEYLEKVYAASSALLAASEGEGFGLPLIEVARHGLPIIARDLPVSREVAGEHAFYFSGVTPEALAKAIETWLGLHAEGRAPLSDAMPWLTWAESTRMLTGMLLDESHPNWICSWHPNSPPIMNNTSLAVFPVGETSG